MGYPAKHVSLVRYVLAAGRWFCMSFPFVFICVTMFYSYLGLTAGVVLLKVAMGFPGVHLCTYMGAFVHQGKQHGASQDVGKTKFAVSRHFRLGVHGKVFSLICFALGSTMFHKCPHHFESK